MKIAQIEAKLIDCMGTDLSVVNAARVSFDKESKWSEDFAGEIIGDNGVAYPLFERALSDKDKKLINYLAKHKHFSPFNHTFLTFRVKAPIFVARQLVKHKFMPWNEVSRRYVDSEPEFYIPEAWRTKAENVKQGSSDVAYSHSYVEDQLDNMSDDSWRGINSTLQKSVDLYNDMLSFGICPEQARMVLPQNTMTEWMWSGTLGAFADMLRLRLDPHTQYESRIVAELIKEQVMQKFPVSLNALLDQA